MLHCVNCRPSQESLQCRPNCKTDGLRRSLGANVVNVYCEWAIANFDHVGSNVLDSCSFSAEANNNLRWRLRVYPRGIAGSSNYVSVFLIKIENFQNAQTCIYQNMHLSILDGQRNRQNTQKAAYTSNFSSENGFKDYMLRSDLSRYVANSTLTFALNLTVITELVDTSNRACDACFNPHEHRLLEDFGQLFHSREGSDIVLMVDDKKLNAHKSVLLARSPVFAAMFASDMAEKRESKISITDITYEALCEMLRFMYTGRVPEKEQVTVDLLLAADKYDLKGLRAACEEVLCWKEHLVETAAEVLVLADGLGTLKLKKSIIDFIKLHAAEVARTDRWNSLLLEKPELLVDLMGIDTNSLNEV